MVESKPSRVENPRSEWRLTARTPIAITNFTDGIVPPRNDIEVNPEMYERLARSLLSVFSATNPDGAEETIIVGPSLRALEVNGLLYFAAPYKINGFDREDIIDDWTDLHLAPQNQKLRTAHATMPGWAYFEESRERISGVLNRTYDASDNLSNDEHDVLIPVLRWKTDAEGNSLILLEPLDANLKVALKEELPEQIKDTDRLDGGMGLMYLAAYSPQQTQWPKVDRYSADSRSSLKQVIGATQILAYAYREVASEQMNPTSVPEDRDLQKSPLLAGLEQYMRTGEVSTIEIVESNAKKEDPWEVREARLVLRSDQQLILDEFIERGFCLPTNPGLLVQMVIREYVERKANDGKKSKA